MFVVKRNGKPEAVSFDKIVVRISKLCAGLDPAVKPIEVAQRVVAGVYDGVKTSELDELAAHTCAQMVMTNPGYGMLGGRILASNLQKSTFKSFARLAKRMRDYVNPATGESAPLVSEAYYKAVQKHGPRFDAAIVHERDLYFDYFGFKTLERSYLVKLDGVVAERPQHLYMRVAVGIHGEDLEAVLETYDLLSKGVFTHATPTLFNAGSPKAQMSSCFLLQIKDDSIEGIYTTLQQCANISKWAGGIGIAISNVRATDSYIRGTGGQSTGIVPMARVFDATARYVNQGNKRKGSIALYLEPWHNDVEDFINLRKPGGKEEARARDLFLALWINDIFMRRVEEDGDWTLMCPNECPGLVDAWGANFDELYESYEREGRGRRTMKARELFYKIIDAQIESGTPYMTYKDAVNRCSNQQNLGTIKSMNLCAEQTLFASEDEIGVCNLASVALPKFVRGASADESPREFDFEELASVVRVMTKNINRVIDVGFYPVEEARRSNSRNRPIGLGVQGLADVFAIMGYAFDSAEARALNSDIFETMLFAAMDASCTLAQAHGPYETFAGSPLSQGKFHFELWSTGPGKLSGLHDWEGLRSRIAQHGVRNCLFVSPMPTASTAQILGNNECFEPFTSNVYTRRVLAGEFVIVNKHLVRELERLGMWCPEVRDAIIACNGSVQHIEGIPEHTKEVFKTAFEIKQRALIDMAADRGRFIDHSQSLNLFVQETTYAKLSSMHMHSWKQGLKTGMYYLRSIPSADPQKVTIGRNAIDLAQKAIAEKADATAAYAEALPDAPTQRKVVCDNEDGTCLMCGS